MRLGKRKNLRIVCICGQRMKVTSEMYGRAAKCVACHQKWFVPLAEEIAGNVEVIYLKDYPELLRQTGIFSRSNYIHAKPSRTATPMDKAKAPAPILESGDAHDEGFPTGQVATPDRAGASAMNVEPANNNNFSINLKFSDFHTGKTPLAPVRSKGKKPLDILKSLQCLCSYQKVFEEFKVRVAMDEEKFVDAGHIDFYKASLQKIREKMLAKLRLRHEEVQKQISEIENEIGRLSVSLRVGEIDPPAFLTNGAVLHSSRESLVRLDHDLQAWQRVDDPYMAGGPVAVDLAALDYATFTIEIPDAMDYDNTIPLYERYCDELSQAMQAHGRCEERLNEWHRLEAESTGKLESIQDGIAGAAANLEREESRILFLRERLQQMFLDCERDLAALIKYRQDVLERDKKGQIKVKTKSVLLGEVESAVQELRRMQLHIQKALDTEILDTAPSTSFVMNDVQSEHAIRSRVLLPVFFYLLAAPFLFMGMLLLSYKETDALHRIVLLPALLILLQPIMTSFLRERLRNVCLVFLWMLQVALIIASFFAFNQYAVAQVTAQYMPSYTVLGALFFIGAFFNGMAVASVIYDYYSLNSAMRYISLMSAGLITGIVVVLPFIYLHLSHPVSLSPISEPDATFISEQRLWNEEIKRPETIAHTTDDFTSEDEDSATADTLSTGDPEMTTAESFYEPVARQEELNSEAESSSLPVSLATNMASFNLIGVVHGEGILPRFRATVTYHDGAATALNLSLGDVIAGEWKAKEYNADSKKLTITDGIKMLVLGAGDRVDLDVSSGEEP